MGQSSLSAKQPRFENQEQADEYTTWLASYALRPLEWVHACYPWGMEGTYLAQHDGPDQWQTEHLNELGERIRAGEAVIRKSVSTGHGVGKTAEVAWIVHWHQSCHYNSKATVTANTQTQLSVRTWSELAYWQHMAMNGWMFDWSATSYKCVLNPAYWVASAIPWSVNNSEAFAGMHAPHVLMVFDEASGVDAKIWEVAEGAMTTAGSIFLAYGNNTRNSGRFYQITVGRDAKRWSPQRVDSRTAKMRNDDLIREWAEDFGEDSDFFRVRVKGMPPKHGPLQFISSDMVAEAMQRDLGTPPSHFPKLMGVDVARQGDDESVIVQRQGRVMFPEILHFNERNTWKFAQILNRAIIKHQPDIVFIDGVGIGGPVVDMMISKFGYKNIIEVQAGATPTDPKLYLNVRIEMWDRMRMWLEIADIPEDDVLESHLTASEYGFEDRTERMRLEKKTDLKKRGEQSPDYADALAMTFSQPIPPKRGGKFITDSEEPDHA